MSKKIIRHNSHSEKQMAPLPLFSKGIQENTCQGVCFKQPFKHRQEQ